MDFTFSPSPLKRLRADRLWSADSPVKESPDKTKSAARDLLSGALKEAIRKEDDCDISDLESLPTPMKSLMASSSLSPFSSPSKRKRKRKSLDKTAAGYHHTFVMKLFDRSVDLAQFKTSSDVSCPSYPLYPVARAWIRNEPSNLNQAPPAPRDSASPEPETDCPEEADSVTRLPPPAPLAEDVRTVRVPPRLEPGLASDLDLELDQGDTGPPANVLLSSHLVKWWSVRKSWKQASAENEKRYQKSLTILKDMQEK